MVSSCEKVVNRFVRYIESRHPEVLLIVRSRDGKRLRLPNVMVLERCGGYMGLSFWMSPNLSDPKMNQVDKFIKLGHDVVLSDNYEELTSRLDNYLSMCRPNYVVDDRQLDLIEVLNSGDYGKTDRSPLTSECYDICKDVVDYVRERHKHATIVPSPGQEFGPDITILSDSKHSIHRGLSIWLSPASRCYQLWSLSHGQFGHVVDMAHMSYLTIASLDYQDITDIIDHFIMGEFEGYNCLPEFCDENCP